MSLSKQAKEKLIKDFAQNPHDTGSSEVQIAMLTENIRLLTEHLKQHSKDYASKRGLLQQVSDRRSLLGYLERKNPTLYRELINRLGLKK